MIERLSPVALLGALRARILTTGHPCYDKVPLDAATPFYALELTATNRADTKTMYMTDFVVNVHTIGSGSVEVLTAETALEEALTENISLPGFRVVSQINNGILVLKTDETGERHAVTQFVIKVAYGLKVKG